jgi:hypothetical protein
VILRSVETAGILLVFSFLVVPAVTAMVFRKDLGGMLAVAFAIAVFASAAGIGLSYRYDLPAGPTVVCLMGVILVATGILNRLRSARTPLYTAMKVLFFFGIVLGILVIPFLLSPAFHGRGESHSHIGGRHLRDALHEREDGIHEKGSLEAHVMDHFIEAEGLERERLLHELKSNTEGIVRLLKDEDPAKREQAATVLAHLDGGPGVVRALKKAFAGEEDEWVKLAIASSLFRLHRSEGRKALESIVAGDGPGIVKARAARLLEE